MWEYLAKSDPPKRFPLLEIPETVKLISKGAIHSEQKVQNHVQVFQIQIKIIYTQRSVILDSPVIIIRPDMT